MIQKIFNFFIFVLLTSLCFCSGVFAVYEESGTGILENTGTGEIEENFLTERENLENFEIKNKFQNPTYLKEKDLEKEEYLCEENGECKVNFNFEESFFDKKEREKYDCKVFLDEEEFSNSKNFCNPNTVSIEKEKVEFKIKIFLKEDESIFKERKITILKTLQKEDENFEKTGTGSQENTGSGEIEDNGNQEEKENFEKNFEIKNKFQNPTYLKEKDLEKEEYFCEENGECKVNFDFRVSFTENFKEKDFSCLFEFGEEILETCNPNTILIEKEEIEFKIKIFNKSDENVFKEKIIKILKKKEEESGTGSQENTGSGEIEDNGSQEEKENFEKNFEIKNKFQNPTYLKEKDLDKEEYFCEKSECKVNFDFRVSFTENFKEKDFSCLFEFGEEILETCNPNTISIEKETEFKIKIFSKKDKNIFKERKILIKIFEKNGGNSNLSTSTFSEIKPKIEVQSGLLNKKCENKNCKVNFSVREKGKNWVCRWHFGENSYYKAWNNEKCNPNYVSFGPGDHTVYLTVYDENKNFLGEDFIEFKNEFQEEKVDLKAKIILTGKSKDYEKDYDFAVCSGTSKCSLNFGLEETSKNIKKYFWNFGNGETFEGKNPKIVEFLEGKYEISLKIFDENNEFKEYFYYVLVTSEEEKNIFDLVFGEEKIEKLFDMTFRKNQNYITVTSQNSGDIIIEQTFDFPIIGSLIFKETHVLKVDEFGILKEKIDYNRPGNFNFSVYKIGENGEKIFSENKEIEITYKNYFDGKLKEISEKNKEKKVEEEKFLKIILQGKETKSKVFQDKKVVCNGECNVNFGLDTNIKSTKKIFWDFGNGETFEGKNPKSIKFSPGNYKIEVKYFEESGTEISDFFEVSVSKKIKNSSKKQKTGPVNLKITVQGKIGQNKILTENKLICYKTCSVNFDGRASTGAYKELFWDFGNGKNFIGENPKSVKYETFGKYFVKLQTQDFSGKNFEKVFEVEFLEEQKTDKIQENLEETENFEQKNLEKSDIFFISIIMFLIFSGSFISLKRYKII